ncbi:hypothetical protein Scep_013227 [Stephania cephalantha]|uniref:Uncharacterized protein n=1 Tax=Stephania cephalantha TaxID=152367 RepID=A0AAP0JH15_9MAGN
MNTDSTPLLTSFRIALLLSILSFAPHHSIGNSASAADTMLAGQSLTANQTLVSKGGKFELGFFTPGNSQKYYVGIWFKKVATIQKKKTIVWVANRNKPITTNDSSSSELKLLENGHLVLLVSTKSNYSSRVSVWSTDSTTSKTMNDSSVKAVLSKAGNLVLTSSSNGNIIWQSFDHLTHAYIPGAKFGYNNVTKKSHKISAWKNSEDPSEGIYSTELGHSRSIDFTWNHSLLYYTSGVWNGRHFSDFPEMRTGNGVAASLEYKSYENGTYFTCSLSDTALPFYVFIDTSGQLKAAVWQAKTQEWTVVWTKPTLCQVHGVCGAFSVCGENPTGLSICQCLSGFEQRYPKDWGLLDYSGGCVRRSSLQCGNEDSFSKMPNIRLTKISPSSANALAMDNAKKCELACLQNCSCSAYAYSTNSSSSGNSIWCSLWYGDLLNIQQLGDGDKGNDLYIRLAPSQDQLGSRMKPSTKRTIVSVVLSGTTILLGIAFFFLRKRWIKRFTRSPKLKEAYAFLTAFRSKDGKVWFFPTWAARKVVSEGQPVLSILDSKLEGKADIEELNRAFRVACWCIQAEEIQRPSMGQVVRILEGLLEVNPPPIQRYLQAMVENEETANFFSK